MQVMKNPHAIWASVVIVIVLMAGAISLTAMNKDASALISLLGLCSLPVLGALGVAVYQKTDEVKNMVNGNTSQLMDALRAGHEREVQLAKMIQPATMVELDNRPASPVPSDNSINPLVVRNGDGSPAAYIPQP
jgi:putative effector of murein hydrolase